MGERVAGGRLAPSLGLMHFALMLAGLGTALLGPILPLLAHEWNLRDSDSGLLMMAKFCGAFLGGVSVSRHLRRSLLVGLLAGACGFGGFAMAPGMAVGCVGLFVGGFGLGQILTATNILAGRRFTKHRGSGLALLNFSFSLGAMLSALLAAWLLPRFALRGVLVGFAGLFVAGAIWIGLEMPGAQAEVEVVEEGESSAGLGRRVYLYFAGLLILYGGLETCLSGWLTTFALRYGDRTLAVSEYTTLLLWMALTFGRVGSSLLMLRVGERTVQRIGLGLAAVFIVALGMSHTALGIATFAVLLGLSLAPFFPATWSLLMGERPRARQAGIVLAVSGLGAAALPWLMGVVSTRTGSLQIALALPLAAAVALLGMSLFPARSGPADNSTG
jgi:MFS transporter, FHS family, glucose/mannose:H+ symporter